MKTVPLGGKVAAGRVALVDDADYELAARHSWHASETPRTTYVQTCIRLPGQPRRYQNMFLHTMLTGWAQVDHRDHDGLNNQRANLRPVTYALNGANRRPNTAGTSRFKGVCWAKGTGKWQAQIRINGRGYYLGQYTDEVDAARAYDAAAAATWGDHAWLNLPDSL